MESFIRLVGPERAVEIFGIRLVGINADNGKKVLLTLVFVLVVVLLQRLARRWAHRFVHQRESTKVQFWTRQGIQLAGAVLVLLGVMSIWFEDPTRLAAALGLVTAGLAFALQRVVTAMAGYVVILRGRTFNVGDRITMGGVRGDVIALSFTQTTIMEMGQPPPVEKDDPAMWVRSREYTGRIVTVTNAKIFDEPVYNYSREFPYIWEELSVPIKYGADRARVEAILFEAARRHTLDITRLGETALRELERRSFLRASAMGPAVYLRMTDNWVELTLRFLVEDHGIRKVKDAVSRDVLAGLEQAGIEVASATVEVVGVPRIAIQATMHGAEEAEQSRTGAGPH